MGRTMYDNDLWTLPGDARVERTYWAVTHHYGFVEKADQVEAEDVALLTGHSVELRAVIAHPSDGLPGGTSDVPLVRYKPVCEPTQTVV